MNVDRKLNAENGAKRTKRQPVNHHFLQLLHSKSFKEFTFLGGFYSEKIAGSADFELIKADYNENIRIFLKLY